MVEIAGIVAGMLGGLGAAALMGVYRSPKAGRPVGRAGWTIGLGVRASRLPAAERVALLDVARPSLVVGVPEAEAGGWPVLE